MTSIEAGVAAVRRHLAEASVAGLRDIEAMGAVAAPDLTVVSPPRPAIHRLANVKRAPAPLLGALSDLAVHVEEVVGEGARGAGRWTVRATTTGAGGRPRRRVPPVRRTLAWTSVGLLRVRDGNVLEEWAHRDWPAVLRQLGVRALPVVPATRWLARRG